MPQQPRDRFDLSDYIATGGLKSNEQCCKVHRRGNNHTIRSTPPGSGRGLDRNPGGGFRNRNRPVGYRTPVPEFRAGKSYYLHQIRWNWSWSGVEPKIMCAYGRRNFRDKRAWPWIVLYDPRARMDD